MKQILYYFELKSVDDIPCGQRVREREVLSADPPQKVVEQLKNAFGDDLQVVYHESNTPDGTPFIVDYEG